MSQTDGNERAVDGFISCLNAHDWDGLANYLADPFLRVGGRAEVDVFTPDGYVEWVKEVLSGVEVYGKEVRRIIPGSDGKTVFADLIEFGGSRTDPGRRNASLYVFSLDDDKRIRRMALYQMPSVPDEPGEGMP
jgi:hypothetical protein